MASLWTLKFGEDNTIPVLLRYGTKLGESVDFTKNKVYGNKDNITDPIDVIKNFSWTKSPQSSRHDVPKLRLIEKRITKNSTVSNLAYSVAAGGDLANTITDVFGGLTNTEQSIEEIKQKASNIANKSGVSDTLTKVAEEANEIFNLTQFDSTVLKPYNFLYATEKTGFEYIFPYLDDAYRDLNINMGTDQANLASQALGAVSDVIQQVAGAAFVLRPGVYIEEAQQFQMSQTGRSVKVSIPLLNTGTFEDILQNWQLIYGLVYQNRPGRITRNLVDVPVIYEANIKGMMYMPYAYISNLEVKFLGNRRTLKLKVPVAGSSNEGSDFNIQLKEIQTVIPDAFMLEFTLTGLNEETRNFMYESIDEGKVVVGTKPVNLGGVDILPSSVTNANQLTDGGLL